MWDNLVMNNEKYRIIYELRVNLRVTNTNMILKCLQFLFILMVLNKEALASDLYQENANVNVQEYCLNHNNVFNATCPSDHVIIMRVARYGRMRLGACMTSDRELGCHADVIAQMHKLCSGRRQCTLNIPDPDLHALYPCDSEIQTYLEAAYDCQRVTTATECNEVNILQLNELPGYLGSMYRPTNTRTRPMTKSICTLQIKSPPGTKIRLTLQDFGTQRSSSENCIIYAEIRNVPPVGEPEFTPSLHQRVDQIICAGQPGEREIMTSQSNQLLLSLPIAQSENERHNLLMNYESVGCADPVVPSGASFARTENSATISCNVTQHTWHVICREGSWVGLVQNCSALVNSFQNGKEESGPRWSFGLLLAVFVGIVIGVALGLVCLFAVTCVYRKSGRECKRYDHTMTLPHEQVHMLTQQIDHGYECARTLQRAHLPSDDEDIACPYHTLRHKELISQRSTPYEKPSIVQDCETCMDTHNPESFPCPPGTHVNMCPIQNFKNLRYLQSDQMSNAINERITVET